MSTTTLVRRPTRLAEREQPPPNRRRAIGMTRVRWLSCVAIAAVGLLVAAFPLYAIYAPNALFHHNLNEVVPGRFYRSSQMSREDLGRTIDAYGIKSVLDMRMDQDEPDETGWTESQEAAAHHAVYRHVPFVSTRADQRDRLRALLAAYDEMSVPILVHCSSGSDRTGVASAIWLLDKEGSSVEVAEDQLAMRFGYLQVERDWRSFLHGKPTLDRVITAYAKEQPSGGVGFRAWARTSPLLGP